MTQHPTLSDQAAKHTPGPWDVDAVRNEGEYGNNGPDTRSGFDSYAILDSEGRVLFDSLNRDGRTTEVTEECDEDYLRAWDAKAKADAWRVVTCVNAHDQLLEALTELVACKALKDKAEALHFAGPLYEHGEESWKAECDRLRADYLRRQPLAWEAARAAIAKATAAY